MTRWRILVEGIYGASHACSHRKTACRSTCDSVEAAGQHEHMAALPAYMHPHNSASIPIALHQSGKGCKCKEAEVATQSPQALPKLKP
eukprot:1157880-Pelagomonas_calceolata.AAC.3